MFIRASTDKNTACEEEAVGSLHEYLTLLNRSVIANTEQGVQFSA